MSKAVGWMTVLFHVARHQGQFLSNKETLRTNKGNVEASQVHVSDKETGARGLSRTLAWPGQGQRRVV